MAKNRKKKVRKPRDFEFVPACIRFASRNMLWVSVNSCVSSREARHLARQLDHAADFLEQKERLDRKWQRTRRDKKRRKNIS